jgi:SAM-dependent methyltransferase
MLILNLGCGTKTSAHPAVVNLDRSIYLRIRCHPLLRRLGPLLARGSRRVNLDLLPDNIRVHDISRGLPYETGSVDVVYHSHLLEHLDRDVALDLLREGRRVLRSGGVQRIVVPDLERLCRQYLASLEYCLLQSAASAGHVQRIADLLEQSVRRESFGSSRQVPWRRWLEGLLLGDARRRGETHQWMYDRVTLPHLLSELEFQEVSVQRFDTSWIPSWRDYGLDLNGDGGEYRPGSLYVEARR